MRRHIVFIVFYLILFFGNSQLLYSQVPQEIVYALKTGNASKLITFFSSEIELSVLNNDGIYDLAESEKILKSFFSKHKPTDFVVLHSGNEEHSSYFIGKLITSSENFRTYVYIRPGKNKKYIYQLRFENEDE